MQDACSNHFCLRVFGHHVTIRGNPFSNLSFAKQMISQSFLGRFGPLLVRWKAVEKASRNE